MSRKLRSDPANVDSQSYEFTIKFSNIETPEEWLVLMKDLKQVLVGQSITTGPTKCCILLGVFNTAAAELVNEPNAHLE
jgi:hypothetical protein